MSINKVVGLNEWARKFVKDEPVLAYMETIVRGYPDGHQEVIGPTPIYQSTITEEDGTWIVRAEGDYPLIRYTLPDGRVYYETIQTIRPDWIGSVYFIALNTDTGQPVPESRWTEAEIQSVL